MSDATSGLWNVVVPAPDGYAQGRLIHWALWSGRWESNPTPNAAKSLNLLAHCGSLASISVQHRSYFLDRFPVRVTYDMSIDL